MVVAEGVAAYDVCACLANAEEVAGVACACDDPFREACLESAAMRSILVSDYPPHEHPVLPRRDMLHLLMHLQEKS